MPRTVRLTLSRSAGTSFVEVCCIAICCSLTGSGSGDDLFLRFILREAKIAFLRSESDLLDPFLFLDPRFAFSSCDASSLPRVCRTIAFFAAILSLQHMFEACEEDESRVAFPTMPVKMILSMRDASMCKPVTSCSFH